MAPSLARGRLWLRLSQEAGYGSVSRKRLAMQGTQKSTPSDYCYICDHPHMYICEMSIITMFDYPASRRRVREEFWKNRLVADREQISQVSLS